MAIQAAQEATGHQERIALLMPEKPADSSVGALLPTSVVIDNFDGIGMVSGPVEPIFVLDLSGCADSAESERVAREVINRFEYLSSVKLRPDILYDPRDYWKGNMESALALLNKHFAIVGIMYGTREERVARALELRVARHQDPSIVWGDGSQI